MDDQDLIDYDELMLDPGDSFYYEDLDSEMQAMLLAQQQGGWAAFQFNFKACLGPTTVQTAQHIGPLLLACLLLRVVSLLRFPRLVSHAVSLVGGVGALFWFTPNSALCPIIMCVLAYPVLFLRPGRKGPVMSAGCLVFIVSW